MLFLKDLIIYLLIFIFIYLIFEYFYYLSHKIIERFSLSENISTSQNVIDFKNIPGQIDFNFTTVGDLSSIQAKIDDLNNRQAANEELLQLLQKQLTASKSTNST